jgi:hypothetical protein
MANPKKTITTPKYSSNVSRSPTVRKAIIGTQTTLVHTITVDKDSSTNECIFIYKYKAAASITPIKSNRCQLPIHSKVDTNTKEIRKNTTDLIVVNHQEKAEESSPFCRAVLLIKANAIPDRPDKTVRGSHPKFIQSV